MTGSAFEITKLLKGTFTCEESKARLRSRIVSTIRRIANNYGYPEMSTPIVYSKELLTYKFDEGTRLAEEIYSLSDKGGRDLALRYDLTVPFARYVADNLKALSYPFRRFECGEVFRDGPVKSGRARQFAQCDIDVVGDADPVVTAYEQMSCALAVFDDLGLSDVKVKYSSRRFANGVLRIYGLSDSEVSEAMRVLDKREKVSEEEFVRELAAAGFPEDRIEEFEREWMGTDIGGLSRFLAELSLFDDISENDPIIAPDFIEGAYELTRLSRLLDADSLTRGRCEFSPSLVRGQDYYTGIMFEAFAPDYSSSLAGGGRYDSIIAGLAGVDDEDGNFSASGISFGIVPISYLMEERAAERQDGSTGSARNGLAFLTCSESDAPAALQLANACRRNMQVDVDATTRGVSKKMKAANKAGYRFVVVFGESERENGVLQVKDMETGNVVEVPAAELRKMPSNGLDALFHERTEIPQE